MGFVLFDVFSLVLYLADIASDIMLLVGYSNSGDWFWFILSFLFVLLPSLVVNCFSFSAYLGTGLSNMEMIVRFIFAILQISPVIRYVQLCLSLLLQLYLTLSKKACFPCYSRIYVSDRYNVRSLLCTIFIA